MLVTVGTLLAPARAHGYAVGSFDVNNVEQGLGVLEAATEKRSPAILAVPEFGAGAALSMDTLIAHLVRLAEPAAVPVAIILDHGRTLEAVVRAIRAGATGVMLDASTRPDEENVALTRQAADMAHWAGISCEGEIGHVGQGAAYATIEQDRARLFTQPDQAISFVERTRVDALAVAVGTAHGHYVGTPRLDFDLLEKLREQVPVPLVLHGGSSTGDENLGRAARSGVAKVNIYTDMAAAAVQRIQAALAGDPPRVSIARLLAEAKGAFRDVSAHYMDVFGSSGRAA
jgi:fructose-bisphosphate aldolase class II